MSAATDKEGWVGLLFEVQAGQRSCRNMADLILAAIASAKEPSPELDVIELREWEISVIGVASETVKVWARTEEEANRKALVAAEDLVVNGIDISWETAGEV